MQKMQWSMAMGRAGPVDVLFDLVLWSPHSDIRIEGRATAGMEDLLRIEVMIRPPQMTDALCLRILTAMFQAMESFPSECEDLAGAWIDLEVWLNSELCERDFQKAFAILSSDYRFPATEAA